MPLSPFTCGGARATCSLPSKVKVRPVSAPPRGERFAPRFSERNAGEPRLVLYSRSCCHLCDQMLAALRLQLGADFPVAIVDVDGDPVLKARYGERVPLLANGDKELCCYRYDSERLAAYLSEMR